MTLLNREDYWCPGRLAVSVVSSGRRCRKHVDRWQKIYIFLEELVNCSVVELIDSHTRKFECSVQSKSESRKVSSRIQTIRFHTRVAKFLEEIRENTDVSSKVEVVIVLSACAISSSLIPVLESLLLKDSRGGRDVSASRLKESM